MKSLLEVLTLKLNFQKKNSDKTLFFMIGPYGSPFLFVLTLAFDRPELNDNVALSTVEHSTRKRYASFKRFSFSRKLVSKLIKY